MAVVFPVTQLAPITGLEKYAVYDITHSFSLCSISFLNHEFITQEYWSKGPQPGISWPVIDGRHSTVVHPT